MTPLQNFSEALHIAFGLALLWFLVFKLAKDYRIDALRDRLFALREKLFDYALSGGVSFNHPAYTKFRVLINSLIRFAHRLTFTRFAAGVVFVTCKRAEVRDQALAEWYSAVETLEPEAQQTLKRMHLEMLMLVVRHLITGSPVMLFLMFVFSLWAALNGIAKRFLEAFTDRLPGLDELQSQALIADDTERRAFAHTSEEALAHR